MPKAARHAGVSRQVKTTTFVHPSQIRNTSTSSYNATTHKITKVLGFKARADEVAQASERLRESMQGMYHPGSKLITPDFEKKW